VSAGQRAGVDQPSADLVRDLMQIGVETCAADTSLLEVVRHLIRSGLEALVVLDKNGHAVGLFGRREAVAAYSLSQSGLAELAELTVADAMRPDVPEIPPDIPASAAAQLMLDQNLRELYLMHHDGGISWPAAVIRFEDVLRRMSADIEAADESKQAWQSYTR
jgi:CBS domain-containing protein